MRKWFLILFLIPSIAHAQASYDVINVNYKADNLNFTTGNGSKFFNLVLTGNVNTSGLNGGSIGMEVIFNICQDNVGGRTFNWPPNVINPPPINSAALACTSTRFVNIGNFQWTNTGNAASTTSPGGSNTQIQYNNNGAFAGAPVTWDAANSRLLAPNGAAANPTYSFTNATGTGMYNIIGGDVGLSVGGSVLVDIGPGLANFVPPLATNGVLLARGPGATLSGTGACATITTQTGSALAGSAKCTGVTAASTLTITFATTAANGYSCNVQDETTRANALQQTSHTTTTCVLTATSITQNDVFVFTAVGF